MQNPPTTDELLAHFVRRSRVPLEEIKKFPHGALFPDPVPAEAAPADWPYRLQLADERMLRELAQIDAQWNSPGETLQEPDDELRLLLVSRREHAVYNSVGHRVPALARKRPYNPAYLNPQDLQRLGLHSGDRIDILSAHGAVHAIAESASDIRRGVLSLAHCFTHAASTAALIDDASDFDALSGLPRMSAIPVRVRRAVAQRS